MKPRTENWVTHRGAGSPASHTTVDTANWDLTCSESKEMMGFTPANDNGDLSDDCIQSRYSISLLLLLTVPS